jgi:hypothetical protein
MKIKSVFSFLHFKLRSAIQPVDVPTNWVLALLVTRKKDGRIRVCKPLRNHYLLPTVEDVLPKLSKAKFLSVLDAGNGFWQVELDEESGYTTTPWGRYRYLRMPFGIAPALEEFQKKAV